MSSEAVLPEKQIFEAPRSPSGNAVEGRSADEQNQLDTLGPDSHTWRDFGSWRFHLMLPQAFLMQVAHPVIDAGVGEHSVYRTDPWGRAKRSTQMLWPVVYARRDDAIQKGKVLRELHRSIKGVDKNGKRYFALDPEAYGWVHVTGYDASIRMHELFGTPPTPEQRQEMFREWRQFGLLLGVRDQDLPATEAEYWEYFERIITGRLEMGEVAKDLLSDSYYFDQPRPPVKGLPEFVWRLSLQVTGRLLRFNTLGTLPPVFREHFNIPWTDKDERRFRRWCRIYRVIHRMMPQRMRYITLARRAMRDAEKHPEAYTWSRT
ncbi:MAG: DUF2236 domain-containing protein [Alcanivorax sp.]|nr:DUF2236 domain-containing protein [Alcanivorax sp.]